MIIKLGIPSAAALLCVCGAATADPARFDTPQAAVSALIAALEAKDKAKVLQIFGPENADVVSTGDPDKDRALWGGFLDDVREVSRIEEADGRATLFAGSDDWPFPAQLALADGA